MSDLVRPLVGVLALHGGVSEHETALAEVGAGTRRVRAPEDLDGLDGLVIPGGETTTIHRLTRGGELLPALRSAVDAGLPTLGTCAGLIVLAAEVRDGSEPLVGGLDVAVRRNAWGRQPASFEAPVHAPALGGEDLPGVFIRAPRVEEVGPAAEVLATCGDEVVAVRQGVVWGTAFHPELTPDRRLHAAFLAVVRAGHAEADERRTGGAWRVGA